MEHLPGTYSEWHKGWWHSETKTIRDVENILKYLLLECQLIYFVQGINSRECKKSESI